MNCKHGLGMASEIKTSSVKQCDGNKEERNLLNAESGSYLSEINDSRETPKEIHHHMDSLENKKQSPNPHNRQGVFVLEHQKEIESIGLKEGTSKDSLNEIDNPAEGHIYVPHEEEKPVNYFEDMRKFEQSSKDTEVELKGPMGWIVRQISSNVDPKNIISQLMPGVTFPQYVDPSTLWKVVWEILTEPKPRNRLEHVNTLDGVVQLIGSCKKIIVLTGAGVSVSCGIPDFRSRDGIYARLSKDFPDLPDPQSMFDIHYFRRDQRPFYKFAKEIYPGEFKPSLSHRFIAALDQKKKLLQNYTQNIDTLEQQAGIEKVVQCHGSFATASCTNCKYQVKAEEIRGKIFDQIIPKCPICPEDENVLAVMKPDIIFFGEGLPNVFYEKLDADKNEADLLIVIGSSLKVRPVALIPDYLKPDVPQILINREPLNHFNFDVELLGNCDDVICEICRRLGEEWNDVCNGYEVPPLDKEAMYKILETLSDGDDNESNHSYNIAIGIKDDGVNTDAGVEIVEGLGNSQCDDMLSETVGKSTEIQSSNYSTEGGFKENAKSMATESHVFINEIECRENQELLSGKFETSQCRDSDDRKQFNVNKHMELNESKKDSIGDRTDFEMTVEKNDETKENLNSKHLDDNQFETKIDNLEAGAMVNERKRSREIIDDNVNIRSSTCISLNREVEMSDGVKCNDNNDRIHKKQQHERQFEKESDLLEKELCDSNNSNIPVLSTEIEDRSKRMNPDHSDTSNIPVLSTEIEDRSKRIKLDHSDTSIIPVSSTEIEDRSKRTELDHADTSNIPVVSTEIEDRSKRMNPDHSDTSNIPVSSTKIEDRSKRIKLDHSDTSNIPVSSTKIEDRSIGIKLDLSDNSHIPVSSTEIEDRSKRIELDHADTSNIPVSSTEIADRSRLINLDHSDTSNKQMTQNREKNFDSDHGKDERLKSTSYHHSQQNSTEVLLDASDLELVNRPISPKFSKGFLLHEMEEQDMHFLFVPPNRYIFHGAEINSSFAIHQRSFDFASDDDDDEDDTEDNELQLKKVETQNDYSVNICDSSI